MFWRHVKSTKKALKKLPVSAKVVLVSVDGKSLVMRKDSGIYDLPGGKVEKDEDLYEALQREVLEETSLSVKKFKFVASWVKHSPELGDRLVLVFECRLKKMADKIKIKLSDEHDWAEFLTLEETQKLTEMIPGYMHVLQICFSRNALL